MKDELHPRDSDPNSSKCLTKFTTSYLIMFQNFLEKLESETIGAWGFLAATLPNSSFDLLHTKWRFNSDGVHH